MLLKNRRLFNSGDTADDSRRRIDGVLGEQFLEPPRLGHRNGDVILCTHEGPLSEVRRRGRDQMTAAGSDSRIVVLR
ncbi:MAG: hypothetical protein ACR2IK_12135 [Chloroflexota bacterium]